MVLLDFFYNTYTSEYTYTDYLDYCEVNEIEPQEEGSNEFWQYLYDERDMEESDILSLIKMEQYPVIAFGVLGLWDGEHTTATTQFDNIESAVYAALRDSMDYKIEYDKGEIIVTNSHHDGTNIIHIRKANGQFIKRPQW